MKVEFSKMERTAGIFVLVAMMGALSALVGTAVRKGWFQTKVPYFTLLENSEGVHAGTAVELAGVRIGSVDSISFTTANRVKVEISIFSQFQEHVRKDSKIQLIRPYVIGDKVMFLSRGTLDTEILPEGSLLPSEEVVGLTDILNGRKLIPYVQTIGAAFAEMKKVIDMLLENQSSTAFVKTLGQLGPLISKLNGFTGELTSLTQQLNQGNNTGRMVRNLASVTDGMARLMPAEGTQVKLGEDMAGLVGNMKELTDEFKKLVPAINEIAPDLPKTSRRMVEAIDEAVVVLKALQKSFLLRGSAKEVKREEAQENGEPINHEDRKPITPSHPSSP